MTKFQIIIQNFEGTDAVCKIENTDYEFNLPIQKLPQGVNEGDSFVINAFPIKDEQTNFARETLEAMLN